MAVAYSQNGVIVRGSGESGIIYKTDFSNYDYVNNIDYPIIGNPTIFSSEYLSDFSIRQSVIGYKQVEFELVLLILNSTTAMPTFLWFDNNMGLAVDNNDSPPSRVLVSTNYGKTNINVDSTITSAGYYWLSNNTFYTKYASNYKLLCDFESNTMKFIHNNVPVVDVQNVPFVNNNLEFQLSPRRTVNSIKIASIIVRKIQ